MLRLNRFLAGALALTATTSCALSQPPANRVAARIDESRVVTLAGNVHPLARPDFALGSAAAEMRLDRMILLLKPSPRQQSELDGLVEEQHNSRSLMFHQWLTPAEYSARFGVSPNDMARITAWLQGHGFMVEQGHFGSRLVVFSGTVAQVEEAFHTQIHRYRVTGAEHIANSDDPQIPAALAGVVGGIVSLHDFRRAPGVAARRALGANPQWNMGGNHYLFPADYATIYDLNPLYGAGTTGTGTAIAIVGRSNIDPSDVAAFRAAAGLAPNNPSVVLDGADPGLVGGDQDESTLDLEWAGAVAPGAQVKLVSAASTATTDGVDLAASMIVNEKLAPVVSVSYGSCEQSMGSTELAFYNSLWEQAASQGMSVFVASGDSGAAGCTIGWSLKASEAGVNGLCSSPYSTCVGGTQFNEGSDAAQYWSNSNSPSQGSALSYIPETVWNESGSNGGVGLWASGGGVSQVYPQPAWQRNVDGASAANGMRAVPDVSMTAAAHDGTMIYENGSYWIVSGTSAAAPSIAGLMALVVENQGGASQGNANPALYALLNAPANPFHATPAGDNSVPGVAGFSATGAAYNLATGLGSVDAALFVDNWNLAATATPTLALSLAAGSIAIPQGSSGTVRITVMTGGSFKGDVSLTLAGLPAGVSARWSANPFTPQAGANAVSLTLVVGKFAPAGSVSATITAQGDGLTASQPLTLSVQPSRRWARPMPLPVFPRDRAAFRLN